MSKALLLWVFIVATLPVFAGCKPWPLWQQFQQHLIEQGRVIDPSDERLITTSEGQSYALFFALVNNDQQRFAELLHWTQKHLAGGDLSARLPAWLWGKTKQGGYGILDDNAASDSDLWIAYSLLEAGRLWRKPEYTTLAKLLALRILREETLDLPGLGRTVLPAPKGFVVNHNTWRLNPSYVPMQVLQVMASIDVAPHWQDSLLPAMKLITGSAAKGFAPDWVRYQHGQGFVADNKDAVGSYGAIRVYLWAGLLAPDSPYRAPLLQQLQPMQQLLNTRGSVPEKINTLNAKNTGNASLGFNAALIPFALSLGDTALAKKLQGAIDNKPFHLRPNNYYEQVLALFMDGWRQGLYRFDRNGHVVTLWQNACTNTT